MDRDHVVSRRQALALGAGGAAALALAGCAPDVEEAEQGGEAEGLVLLSTQFQPVQEAEKMRSAVLGGFDREVEFIGEEIGPFVDRIQAEAQANKGTVALLGGQHGDFSGLAAAGVLEDLSDLAGELSDRGFNADYLELAKLGGDATLYIPWAQASYIMAARNEAMDLLPSGADVASLTYDQVDQWAAAVAKQEGSKRFGLPVGEEGLIHRFLQGYSYPSFTGALNTTFSNGDAVAMWQWIKGAWANANPQSTTYAFMQEPLRSGEVWVAWDHVARLIEALRAGDVTAFPAPSGPEGLGYMPVVAGLAIPKTSPDKEGAKDLIRYLTDPATTAITARELGFFPPFAEAGLPGDVDPAIRAEADAIAAQAANPQAIPSLLPVGLQDKSDAYSDTFKRSFDAIVLRNQDIQKTLDDEAQQLQALLESVQAPCWQPDPPSSGTCQVG